jgi:hypothetical protein
MLERGDENFYRARFVAEGCALNDDLFDALRFIVPAR